LGVGRGNILVEVFIMKSRRLVLFVSILATAALGGLSSVHAQEPPKKVDAPPEKQEPVELKSGDNQGATIGGTSDMEDTGTTDTMQLAAQVDAQMQRVGVMVEKAQSLSRLFGDLAALHEGADKSEILMMQRMSDSMGAMAGEVKMSLQQYKKMLGDETASESGTIKADVQRLKGVMDGIVDQIAQGLQMLQAMQAQLGQG
jgi:hypothetical protein